MKNFIPSLFLISALQLTAAGPLFEKSDVFPPGLNGIARSRIPGIVVTQKGTVLGYEERTIPTRVGRTFDAEE